MTASPKRNLLPILVHGRRRQGSTLPVVDGVGDFCKEAFTKPYIDGESLTNPHFCTESFSHPAIADIGITFPHFCEESLVSAGTITNESIR